MVLLGEDCFNSRYGVIDQHYQPSAPTLSALCATTV